MRLSANASRMLAALKTRAGNGEIPVVPVSRELFGDSAIGMSSGIGALFELHEKGHILYRDRHNVAGNTIPTATVL